ncbi:MAG: DUF3179 domain-containing protein [Gammaproteobacteria bacterium]|nr:DUF3179 domain-containing protein [Gammaproteobacteria bacterium]
MAFLSSFLFRDDARSDVNHGTIILACIGFSAAIGLFGTAAMTELGQLVDMPRSWIFGFFQYKTWFNLALVALSVAAIYLNRISLIYKPAPVAIYALAMVACLFFINWFAAEVWLRSQHHDAEFVSVTEADSLLEDSTDVFVLEIDGDARAYPRDWMQLPHIAGDQVGGQNTVMTYCALSNLPMAFDPDSNGSGSNFRVIAQVHNNLIFTDRNNGELYQQITATGEYGQSQLEEYPVQRMPWHAFRELYPDGQVFMYRPNPLDKLSMKLFDVSLAGHYEGTALFPTLDLQDQRLAYGEQIWGLKEGGKQVAFGQSAFEKNPLQKLNLGGVELVVVWFEKLETVAAFYADPAIDVASANDIDTYGHTDSGNLKRARLYSGVLWMVWSHWFPETGLYL